MLSLVVDSGNGKAVPDQSGLMGLMLMLIGFGAVATWAGVQMTWNRVYLTSGDIASMNTWLRRAAAAEVVRIDIRRCQWGKLPRVTPLLSYEVGGRSN